MGLTARLTPRRVIEGAIATLPAPDQAMLARPEFQQGFIAMVREAVLAGPRGAQSDTALMTSPWDVHPQDIRLAVYLWHGEQDANAPLAMGRYMAAAIPNSKACFYPAEGHLSLISKFIEEILNILVA